MVIKIKKPRAEIRADFKTHYESLAAAQRKTFADRMRSANERCRRQIKADNLILLRNINLDWDTVATRLRTIHNVEAFYAVAANQYGEHDDFLVARTGDVVMDGEAYGQFDMGPYMIAVSRRDLIRGIVDGIQLVPKRDPGCIQRHPHHYAVPPQGRTNPHPLTYRSSLCVGGFGTALISCSRTFDVVALFRNLVTYLHRYNPHSVLYAHHDSLQDRRLGGFRGNETAHMEFAARIEAPS